jgi:hypothetical protein
LEHDLLHQEGGAGREVTAEASESESSRKGTKEQRQLREPSDAINELSSLVSGAAMEVHTTLGPGFLESTYEQGLAVELQHRGIPFTRQTAMELRTKALMLVRNA